MAAIELRRLARTFSSRNGVLRRRSKEVVALRALDLEVGQGELFGIVGPNGAGKTTAIKILTTLLLPTSGSAFVLGRDVTREAGWVRSRIGFMLGGERGLYYRLSGRENLSFFAELYRVPARDMRRRIDDALELLGLKARADERVETYSRGMKQRLHIARTLLHRPSVLFLDEPTVGLDPIGARELRRTIADLHAGGVTIVLATHYMFEAELLCQRIGVLRDGQLLAVGTPADLKSHVNDLGVVDIETFGSSGAIVERLKELDCVESVHVERRELVELIRVHTPIAEASVSRLIAATQGVEIGRVSVRPATLEDAYIRLVGGAP